MPFTTTNDEPGDTIGAFYLRVLPTLERKSLNSTHGKPLREYAGKFADVRLTAHLRLDVEGFVKDYGDAAVTAGHERAYAEEHALAAIRWFYKLARAERRVHWDPTEGLRAPDRPDNFRRRLLYDEQNDISHTTISTGLEPLTDDTVLRVLRETAARICFPINAKFSDIDHGLCALRVYGKNQHNGLVPISRGLLEALVHLHHKYAPDPGNPNMPLILKPNGRGISGRKFDSLFSRIHSYAPWTANPAVTAHWFRHTTLQELDFVTRREVVEAYAGNRPKKAIAIYAKVPFSALREAHDAIFDNEGNPYPERQREFDKKMRGDAA